MRAAPSLFAWVATLVVTAGYARAERPVLAGVQTHDAGEIRVHYATTGVDAVPMADADTDGVPDFVNEVADTASDALVALQDIGFRRPVDDGVLGGDNRIDIYLRNLQQADGNVSSDSCANGTCVSYATAENDFAGYAYASRTEAIRSVVPHELFHMIQYAYTEQHVSNWSEGTAVWAVEHLYGAENSDFERFVPGFLTKTFRPFERSSGGFSDSYPYGAALWPVFLEEKYGAELVREAWEGNATASFLDAIDAALVIRGSSLNEAWVEFTRWNGFTGPFAIAGAGYAAASTLPAAPREPLLVDMANVYVEGLSARYLPVQVTEASELVVAPTDGIDVEAFITPLGSALTDGTALEGDGDVRRVNLAPGMYSMVLTGLSQNTITTKVELSLGVPTDEGGDGGGGCASAPDAGLAVALLLLFTLGRVRRQPPPPTRIVLSLIVAAGATTGIAFAQEPPAETPAAEPERSDTPLSDEELVKLAEAKAAGEVIVVTGTKSETPRAASAVTVEVIDRKRIQESGVQTVSEALSLRPGIWIERGVNGDPGVSMQGLGPQYTLILVDGARQIGRTDGVMDLDRFSVQNIEQIEIVRGPASVLYGSDALGGVINIVTRPPKNGFALDGLFRIDSRLSRETRGRLSGGRGKWSGSLSGSYRDADPVRIGNDGSTLATSIDAYDDARVTAAGSYRPTKALRIDASGDYGQRDLRGIDASATGAVYDRRNLVETATGGASATYAGENTAWRAEARGSFYRDQYLLDQRMSTAEDQYQITDENLIETRFQVAHQRGRHRGLLGMEGLREALKTPRLVNDLYNDRYRGAVFAQDEWKLGKDYEFLVVPAARLDYDTQFGVNATPRLAARWQLDEGTTVRGSFGMGYRAPNFKELLLRFANPGVGYVVEGNPDLDPETSLSGQLGGEIKVNKWLWFSGDAYFNRLYDMIFEIELPSDGMDLIRYSYGNIGNARTVGGELFGIATHGRAAVELGYALNVTRDLDADLPLQNLPRHRVTATARWRDPKQKFDAFFTAVMSGQRPFYVIDPAEPTMTELGYTDRRFELRARVSKVFKEGYGAFLGCDNILDAGDNQRNRLQPRTIYTGVEFQL